MTFPDGRTHLRYSRGKPVKPIQLSGFSSAAIGEDLAALGVEVLPKSGTFVSSMQGLNGLFERDCNQQADGDGGDLDEKGLPRTHGLMRSVYFEHRTFDLGRSTGSCI
jgi:hypothetical protein